MLVLVGPTPLSGIGQVMLKYCALFQTKNYLQYGQQIHPALRGNILFAFMLPLPAHIQYVKSLQHRFKRVVAMTVCESFPVHKTYGNLASETQWTWAVPSEFCRSALTRQFPHWKMSVLRHWVPVPKLLPIAESTDPSIFYTIANDLQH